MTDPRPLDVARRIVERADELPNDDYHTLTGGFYAGELEDLARGYLAVPDLLEAVASALAWFRGDMGKGPVAQELVYRQFADAYGRATGSV